MICFADRGMAPALSALWQECFGDEEGYVNLYLEHLFRPEEVLVAVEEGQPIAMLTLLPLHLCVDGATCRGRYVYAVATARAHRGKGLSTALLEEAAAQIRAWGEDFALLVPAEGSLFGFYGARGYETAFHQSVLELDAQAIAAAPALGFAPGALEEQRALRDRFFCGQGPFAGWGEEMLAYIQREQVFTGGGVLTFPGGYGVYGIFGEQLVIKELVSTLCPPPEAAAALAGHLGFTKATLRLAPAFGGSRPYAMLRWCGDSPAVALNGTSGYFGLGLD